MRAIRASLTQLAASALVALLAATPAAAQGTDEGDALMGSLLQVEDLPAGFVTLGPEEGSAFDIDSGAFSRYGGRRVVSQAWSSETSGVVFDFRMELPSPAAAASYLDEAASTLSEADVTGLALEDDDEPIGEDARHYHGVTRIDAERSITFDNHLFRIGPVAAKVFVASVDLPDGTARLIAERAAERMAGFASPDVAPEAFEGAPPGTSASGSPSPAASPVAAGRLAALVPVDLAESCGPFSSGIGGETAALTCRHDGDLVVYAALEDADALATAFEDVVAVMPAETGSASCAEGPFRGPYPDAAAPRGEVACWDPPGDGLVLFWTDEANLVMGAVQAGSADHEDLDAAWQAALLP
jgi:hypothetical protein